MFDLALTGGWAGRTPVPALPASSSPATALADAQVAGEVLAIFDQLVAGLASSAPVEGAVDVDDHAEAPAKAPLKFPMPAPIAAPREKAPAPAAASRAVEAFVPPGNPERELPVETEAEDTTEIETKRFPESCSYTPVAVDAPAVQEDRPRRVPAARDEFETAEVDRDAAETTPAREIEEPRWAPSTAAAPAQAVETARAPAATAPKTSHIAHESRPQPEITAAPVPARTEIESPARRNTSSPKQSTQSLPPSARVPSQQSHVREESRAAGEAPKRELPPSLPALPEPAAHAQPMAVQVSHVFNPALRKPFVAEHPVDDAVAQAAPIPRPAPDARPAKAAPATSRPDASTGVTAAQAPEVRQNHAPVLPRPVVPVHEVHRDRPDFDRPRPLPPAVVGALYSAAAQHAKHLTFDIAPAAAPGATEQSSLPAATGDQIVQSLRMALTRDGGEARITLNPREFGDLTVTVKVEQGAVVARMQADTPAVREWLHANQETLRTRLADQELRLDRLDIASPEEAGESRHDAEGRRRDQHADERPRPRRPPHSATFEVVA